MLKANSQKLTVNRRGFSALEMLLVLGLIVLLLGAAALVGFRDQPAKNRNTERRNEVNAIKDALTQWSLDTGTYTPSNVPTVATCVSNCNEVVALVRQDCTGYSNCFTSLFAWEAGYGGIDFGSCMQGDLVCAGKSAVAKIDGAWTSADTTRFSINGWTTSLNNYIKIYTTPEARHTGKWDATKYRMEIPGATNYYIIENYENYVHIDGLQLSATAPPSGFQDAITAENLAGSGEILISNNIISLAGATNTGSGISTNSSPNIVVKAWNNVFIGGGYGMYIYGTHYVYNNVFYNCNNGIRKVGATAIIVAKNNITQNCNDGYGGTFSPSSDYNISDLAGDAPGANSQNSITVSFVDTTNRDFHLSPGDTAAKDKGADLSADANLAVKGDIDSQVRTGSWDIGVDEYGASGVASAICYDLKPILTPAYFSEMPVDPLAKNSCPFGDTGYTIYKDTATKEIVIGAPMAENGETIQAIRK